MGRTEGHTGSRHSTPWRSHPSHTSNKKNKEDCHRATRTRWRGLDLTADTACEPHKSDHKVSKEHTPYYGNRNHGVKRQCFWDRLDAHNLAPGGGLFPCCGTYVATLACGHEGCKHCLICTTCRGGGGGGGGAGK